MKNIVEFKDVNKSFGQKKVLHHVTLELEKGKIIGLLGANGSGKTTIIKLINDLLKPTSGSIKIGENQPGVASKKIISYLPERTYLDFDMKVSELIVYFADFYEDFQKEKAFELLEKLQINVHDRLKTMSKGTKEKVQLVLVMSRKADLYILDEPIGGVDPATRDYILDTILTNFKDGSTILISTHLIADIERILDEVIFIKNGVIILKEEADKLRNERKQSIDAIFREEYKC